MPAPTKPMLDLSVACVAARWRIVASGELDLRSGGDLVGVAGVLAAARVPGVTIDVSDIGFIDTAGWNALRAARHTLEESGAPVEILADGPAMQRFLRLIRLVAPDRDPGLLAERVAAV